MKELILNCFYFGRVSWSWKNWFLTVSTFGGCGGHERTDFEQFLLWEGVVVMKELILNSFYFGRVWWSWKNWFLTVSTLGGCGGHERTDFEQFLLWEGVVVLKELIWTVSTLGGCGGLGRTYGRCTGKHWGHTRGCLNILGYLGIRRHQGVSECMGASKHMGMLRCPQTYGGVNSMPQNVELTCH